MTARYIVGDALETLKAMPDASVDLVLSSPPFLALRSYLPPDDPNKAAEMGSESAPGEFLDRLLDVVEECRRVLAPHGSLVLELGDTYAGSGGAGGDYNAGGLRDGQERFSGSASKGRLATYNDARGNPDGMRDTTFSGGNTRTGGGFGWPLAKSLTMVPELFRISLAYGFNPLSGRETPRWRIRNVVRWIRPNPPVGALADKFRPATTEFLVACVGRSRWFDLEAVRRPTDSVGGSTGRRLSPNDDRKFTLGPMPNTGHSGGGAPPLDWFEADEAFPQALKVSPGGYRGAHYAVFPEKVIAPFVEAMCPRRVCTECGLASTRIIQSAYVGEQDDSTRKKSTGRLNAHDHPPEIGWERNHETLGWTDCGHNAWRSGLVLDPFAGTGTVLMVAHLRGRDSVGIDLDPRNAELAQERFGLFPLEVA